MSDEIATFEIIDQAGWDKGLANNVDPYGRRCYTYAADWAHLMEAELAKGKTIAECAKSTSRTADTDGITGFMYVAAVSILSKAWKHGEELRRWHNLDTQIGTEGERANESGGVLNPALLNIGDRINGTPQNHHWTAQFDATDGYIGITQFEAGSPQVKNRVLLSPAQYAALVAFVNDAKCHRESSHDRV